MVLAVLLRRRSVDGFRKSYFIILYAQHVNTGPAAAATAIVFTLYCAQTLNAGGKGCQYIYIYIIYSRSAGAQNLIAPIVNTVRQYVII